MACTTDYVLKGLLSYCLGLSFLRTSLFWTRSLVGMAYRIRLRSFGSLSLLGYDRVFCIHEVLSRMDEFYHGLGLFFVKLVDEKIEINPIVECR